MPSKPPKVPAGLTLRDGYWRIRKTVRVGAERIRLSESTGCPEADLRAAIAVLQARVAEAQRGLLTGRHQIRQEHTWDDAAAEYVVALERKGKDPARAINDMHMLSPWIGALPLSGVHQRSLRPFEEAARAGWTDSQGGRHGPYRSGTVSRAYDTCIAVLTLAARVLRDGDTPWLGQAVPRITAPDWGDKTQPHHFTWAEQDALVGALPGHLVAPVLFACATGAREQEVVSLRWEQHVALAALPRWSCWWIPPSVRKGSGRLTQSQQEGRWLIAGGMARSVVEAQAEAQRGHVPPEPLVFPSPRGGQLTAIHNTGWRRALAKVGIVARVHDLRHTWGKRAEAAGIPLEYRSALLGHRVGGVTYDYSPPGLARLVEEADKVTRQVNPILRPLEGGVRRAK